MSTSIIVPAISLEFSKLLGKIFYNDQKPTHTVYVVGNGWASYHFVKNLDKNKFNPVVISPNSKVLNTPKLISRIYDPNYPVEFDNTYINNHLLCSVTDIDPKSKKLELDIGYKINYDKVVFAIGSEPNDFGIQGVESHTYKLKTISDADLIREKISKLNTESKIYIVGSGVTGIELSSRLAKLGNQINMIEGLDDILPGFNSQTKSEIKKIFEINFPNVALNLNKMVNTIIKLDKQILTLNTFDKKNNISQSTLINPFDIIIWTGGVRFCGFKKTKLYSSLNLISPIKPRGIDTNLDFTIGNNNDIYCIGDMVANSGPPTAQNARLQGEWLAQYFNSGFDKEYLKSNKFKPNSSIKLIHLDSKIWLESKYYSGYVPQITDKIVDILSK